MMRRMSREMMQKMDVYGDILIHISLMRVGARSGWPLSHMNELISSANPCSPCMWQARTYVGAVKDGNEKYNLAVPGSNT
jgi:hypothetical protein